jgi:hypothetical protein
VSGGLPRWFATAGYGGKDNNIWESTPLNNARSPGPGTNARRASRIQQSPPLNLIDRTTASARRADQ